MERGGGEQQPTDELVGVGGGGGPPGAAGWSRRGVGALRGRTCRVTAWLDDGVQVVKAVDLLARPGVVVPERTLHRFCSEELGYRKRRTTVRVNDGEPGGELQVDFGRMGLLSDPAEERRANPKSGLAKLRLRSGRPPVIFGVRATPPTCTSSVGEGDLDSEFRRCSSMVADVTKRS